MPSYFVWHTHPTRVGVYICRTRIYDCTLDMNAAAFSAHNIYKKVARRRALLLYIPGIRLWQQVQTRLLAGSAPTHKPLSCYNNTNAVRMHTGPHLVSYTGCLVPAVRWFLRKTFVFVWATDIDRLIPMVHREDIIAAATTTTTTNTAATATATTTAGASRSSRRHRGAGGGGLPVVPLDRCPIECTYSTGRLQYGSRNNIIVWNRKAGPGWIFYLRMSAFYTTTTAVASFSLTDSRVYYYFPANTRLGFLLLVFSLLGAQYYCVPVHSCNNSKLDGNNSLWVQYVHVMCDASALTCAGKGYTYTVHRTQVLLRCFGIRIPDTWCARIFVTSAEKALKMHV